MQISLLQVELNKEKELNTDLMREKATLDHHSKELQIHILELETALTSDNINKGNKRLESQIEALSLALENETKQRFELARENKKVERQVKDLLYQISEKEKAKLRSDEEASKWEEKVKRLKSQLDELEMTENNLQLSKRRAEREAADEKEKSLRLERENEKLKTRLEKAIAASI
ncbi:hypothetical protein ROZALSC1DRAFT_14024 [Rozella allomycis CSF55]|nr:hypothetical protein ROZALSC1DRAFT_14024 [Rozella allomycis CSF55]